MHNSTDNQPLAARLRPSTLADFFGQAHLLAPGKPLALAVAKQQLHSMILWGPAGSGKTTLAALIAGHSHAQFIQLSAVMAGVKDIREAVAKAEALRHQQQRATVLFIDEIHRFSKVQQDAFLPYVEDGTLTLIGATTENPSFALTQALLSRARVYVLTRLTEDDLSAIMQRALRDIPHGLGAYAATLSPELQNRLVVAAEGDARCLLNYLELLISLADANNQLQTIDDGLVDAVLSNKPVAFDNKGDHFYDLISALHKSVRGSSPDAALYWLARMLVGGCDLAYLARRVVRMASEDIGNADPRALQLALNAWDVVQRLGSPEGELSLAQAVVYLACAAKSNAVYIAFNAARQDAAQHGALPVPLHLRNAPTQLLQKLGHGHAYRYAHDEPHAYAAGEDYFPENFSRCYYQPTTRGLEGKIAEKLQFLRELDKSSKQ